MTSPAASATCCMALTEFGWEPVDRGRQRHRPDRPRRRGQPRARRPARAVGRAARASPPDLRRGRPPPRPGQGGRREARRRASSASACGPTRRRAELPVMPKGRYAIMLDYMPQGRQPRPRHDAAHLHHPDQPRLCVRSRHGAEVPRRPRAAAARHRAVRQFALHRRQAQRLPLLPQPHLVGHRPATAPACCPSCSRTASATSAISITRSTCRCTSSSATATTSTPPASPSAISSTGGCPALPGEKPRLSRLHRPSLDHLPRGPAEELPRDARRRRRPLEPDLRAARALGRPALRRGRARRRLGRGQALDPGRAPAPARRRAEAGARRAETPGGETPARARQRGSSPSPRRGSTPAAGSTAAGDNESGFLDPLREVARLAARPRPSGCSSAIMANGRGDISRIYEEKSF